MLIQTHIFVFDCVPDGWWEGDPIVTVLQGCLRKVQPDLAAMGEFFFFSPLLPGQSFVRMIAKNMTYLSIREVCVNGRPLAGGGLILRKHQPVIAAT